MTERDVSAVRVDQTGSSTGSGTIGAGTDVTQHSVGELVKEVTQDLTKLFNQELALAKLEVSNEAKKAGKTAGAYAGAGVAGYFLVLFASLTLMFALASLFDSFVWAALAVTVLWAIVAAVLYSKAKKTAAQINPKPEMTVQTLKEDAQWAKTREELRAEIARTRAELGQDLDVLVEKVTPSKVVERKVDATKEAVVGVKEKIMGSASSAKESVMGSASSASSSTGSTVSGAGSAVAGSVSSAGHTVADRASSAGHTVADVASQAPTTVKQKASGNPFAAGVVAFGLGWLVSSLLPASKVEQQGADKLKEAAQAVAEPVKQGLTSAATEVKEHLAPAAQEAVQAVKQEATDAASTVKDQAGQAQSQVKEQATTSAGTVKETASSAAQDAKQQATSPGGSTPPPATAGEPTVAIVVEEDVFPADPTAPGSDYTSGRVPPRPTI